MKRQKYIDITVEGQDNIGIIDLGVIDEDNWTEKNGSTIKLLIEEKMVKALGEHFDCPVKVIITEVLSSFGHIKVQSTVIIESDGGDYQETVNMQETWLY